MTVWELSHGPQAVINMKSIILLIHLTNFILFMKKILLLAVAALMVTSAGAQLKQTKVTTNKAMKELNYEKPQALVKEMHANGMQKVVTNGPKKASGYVDAYWRRPAGVFPGIQVMENGAYAGSHYMPFYFVKPYADHEFWGVAEGAGDDAIFSWEYLQYVHTEAGWEQPLLTYEGNPLVVNYVWGDQSEVPTLIVEDPSIGNMYFYQPGGYEMSGDDEHPVAGDFHVSYICALTNCYDFYEEEGTELLVSSKTFTPGGRHADQRYMYSYYSGCEPYGDNESGYWFGKNAGRTNGMPVNGIAQAFEKPQYPYLLKQVVMETTELTVTGPVEMTCHVYKLPQGIPQYDPENTVGIYEEDFGEEIAYGRASLTPETNDVTGGMIVFTLYGEEDGLEYEITPTIEDAIIITIDGYNDEGMENLANFSALISADTEVDEGYGELAYIKYGLANDDGTFSGDYVWAGLNNFFSAGNNQGMKMMTGLTIYITVENPFLTYNYNIEDGEFTFPDEGGLMEKVLYEDEEETIVTRSIEFFSSVPSVDEGWTLTCNGDDVPDWLSIELTDGEDANGEFDNSVLAEVTAEPLPEGVAYREAVVRFGFPGAFLDYTFKQGVKSDYPKGDVNGDREVNIADINALIAIILGGEDNSEGRSDVNGDGEVNIADINAVIAIILGGGAE